VVRSLTTQPALSGCSASTSSPTAAGIYTCATGLTYTPNFGTNSTGPYSFVLSGQFVATVQGTINYVGTQQAYCSSLTNIGQTALDTPPVATTTTPLGCLGTSAESTALLNPNNSFNGYIFSLAAVSQISVVPNQAVLVTVTYTFM
jgi:hypothetical protein